MGNMMRLDRFLTEAGAGTRSEVKKYIRAGRVTVAGERAARPEIKLDPDTCQVLLDGAPVSLNRDIYLMLHKPAGVISATEDPREKTVLDLIDLPGKERLFPVGRLDKDTTGLLLLTDDGQLGHFLTSPKKHVKKRYLAQVRGRVSEEDVRLFKEGLQIDPDWKARPADLYILKEDEISLVEVVLTEGRFHQVKRMFEAVDKKVISLKRLSMGPLILDEKLAPGQWRHLTEEEIKALEGQGHES